MESFQSHERLDELEKSNQLSAQDIRVKARYSAHLTDAPHARRLARLETDIHAFLRSCASAVRAPTRLDILVDGLQKFELQGIQSSTFIS